MPGKWGKEGEKFRRDRKEKAHKERRKQRKVGVNLVMKSGEARVKRPSVREQEWKPKNGFERRCVETWIGDAAYSPCTPNLQLLKNTLGPQASPDPLA